VGGCGLFVGVASWTLLGQDRIDRVEIISNKAAKEVIVLME